MAVSKAAFAVAFLWTTQAAAQEQAEIRTYDVHHAVFGDIGTLSDKIIRDGVRTRVVTRADIRVDLLGITLHHVRADWNETWHSGMLTSFSAITIRNSSTDSVSGRHKDGRFIVRAGEREFDAPAEVHPVHPWSIQFVHAAILMSPESGQILSAKVDDKGYQSIRIGGMSRHVRYYVVNAGTTSHLYFDDDGRLLHAEYRDITGTVSFTLRPNAAPQVASVRTADGDRVE
jgi:hypothetical protein